MFQVCFKTILIQPFLIVRGSFVALSGSSVYCGSLKTMFCQLPKLALNYKTDKKLLHCQCEEDKHLKWSFDVEQQYCFKIENNFKKSYKPTSCHCLHNIYVVDEKQSVETHTHAHEGLILTSLPLSLSVQYIYCRCVPFCWVPLISHHCCPPNKM